MIPQLAKPRHHSHPYRSLGSGPYIQNVDNPAETLLPHPDLMIPTQTMYPVRGSRAPRSQSASEYLGDAYYDVSQHMLRRKTPNGTLAAGYDGTPVDWASRPPPFKHMLLPLDDDSSPRTMNLESMEARGFQRQEECREYKHTPSTASDLPSIETDAAPGVDRTYWSHFTALPSSGVGLGFNESMRQPCSFQFSKSAQIPTALQPTYRFAPVLTASKGDSLYGPYWPDGRFVPYRPAAVSHQRYLISSQEVVNSAHAALLSQDARAHFHAMKQSPAWNGQFMTIADEVAVGPIAGNREVRHSASTTSHRQYLRPRVSAYLGLTDGPNTYSSQPLQRMPDFKDRILYWAHGVYVELLGSMQQSKRDERQARQTQGSKSAFGAVIFPKPPRPSSGTRWSLFPAAEPHAPSVKGRPDFGNSAHSCNPSSTVGQPSLSSWRDRRFSERRKCLLIGHDGSHYAAPFQEAQISDAPLPTRARNALEMLTALCKQANGCWIDGMLLSGCLAYGLEDYQQASDWYSKILDIDPEHVEAISNLAATLLALNQRVEAQKRWLQAIRLRPSYFEAVEHLVGVFCADQRSKDAVTIIEYVERCLKLAKQTLHEVDRPFLPGIPPHNSGSSSITGHGSSGFSIPASENGRILALIHAKGNMLYALGDISGASKAFEDAVLISTDSIDSGIQGLICKIISILSSSCMTPVAEKYLHTTITMTPMSVPLLLPPDKALRTARLVFSPDGGLPGLRHVPEGLARKAAVSTTSNSLLSLAKIYQDTMSNNHTALKTLTSPKGIGDILALYYLSLSLAPSPSTANNVGILLASIHSPISHRAANPQHSLVLPHISGVSSAHENSALAVVPGIHPGTGVALALAYYNYGLNLDATHAHLYTNLGSLLKDLGQLTAAIKMYEQAVACDGAFDIALANLANAVKDQGRTSDAIEYYKRAVAASPHFAEAVCGLANALNSVCNWAGRGGVVFENGRRDRWHVDDAGMIMDARSNDNGGGWIKRVVDIVAKQLKDGASWGCGTLRSQNLRQVLGHIEAADTGDSWPAEKRMKLQVALESWAGHHWEGARIVRLIERATRRAQRRWYDDRYVKRVDRDPTCYLRPLLPANLAVPPAPTVLPFHTFTCPLSAKEIRMISQRNGLRISCSTLRASWMQGSIFRPPAPPDHHLNVGYVSSDFNNHPLAHLMQSVFGFHDPTKAKAFCYATTASDHSVHRQQIEREAPVFRDASLWSAERLVQQIVDDGIHILVNLNGYTRGARNEIFAARPAPIQMAFMGFAGTLGAEWCDYLLADDIAIPSETLRPWRRNVDIEDQLIDEQSVDQPDWVYSENIIFCRDTFFCCDHAQSESKRDPQNWEEEQSRRWEMRRALFPSLSDKAIIFGNFNQLYKIEPTTFRTWLRILDRVPNAILWLLRFPDLGETNLKRIAHDWAGQSVASRIWFTDVAPKQEHISRARVCDLFLDTPECNAHTTAADVLWSSTPLLTLPRYKYKMCSRMAASIIKGALPKDEEGARAANELIAQDDDHYEELAIMLANGLSYRKNTSGHAVGVGRLAELRRLLYESRSSCALFNTRRWVSDLEMAYEEAWHRWVRNDGGDIRIAQLGGAAGIGEASRAC